MSGMMIFDLWEAWTEQRVVKMLLGKERENYCIFYMSVFLCEEVSVVVHCNTDNIHRGTDEREALIRSLMNPTSCIKWMKIGRSDLKSIDFLSMSCTVLTAAARMNAKGWLNTCGEQHNPETTRWLNCISWLSSSLRRLPCCTDLFEQLHKHSHAHIRLQRSTPPLGLKPSVSPGTRVITVLNN